MEFLKIDCDEETAYIKSDLVLGLTVRPRNHTKRGPDRKNVTQTRWYVVVLVRDGVDSRNIDYGPWPDKQSADAAWSIVEAAPKKEQP